MRKFLKMAFTSALALAAPFLADASAAPGDGTVALDSIALAPDEFVWRDPGTAEPITVVISVPMQQAYVYRGRALVAASAVSTGKEGDDTPTGVYPILQKAEKHRSNLYDASMPYMQRLTWDGIALHAGPNPGFPASHGCVRMPAKFARKLFEVTDVGTKVVVTDDIVLSSTLDPELLRTAPARADDAGPAAPDGN